MSIEKKAYSAQLNFILESLKKENRCADIWKQLNQLTQQMSDDDQLSEIIDFNNGEVLQQLYQALMDESKAGRIDDIEDILDSTSILSDTDKGREIGWPYLEEVIDLLSCKLLSFSSRLEVCKLVNILLERFPKSRLAKQKEQPKFKRFLESFGKLIKEAGDFDLQATLAEAVFRIVEPHEKEEFAKQWFNEASVKSTLLQIRNSDFENGCRKFLNELNSHCRERSVYSMPCLSFSLGMYKLHGPGGDSKPFWVDFNTGSKSISAFVRDDANLETDDSSWEIVVIKVDCVRDLRVNDSGDEMILILKLTVPACELVPFCPKNSEHYAKITFSKNCIISDKVSSAISSLFGEVRYVELPFSSSSISSTPTKSSTAKMPFRITSKNEQTKERQNRTEMSFQITSTTEEVKKNETDLLKEREISLETKTARDGSFLKPAVVNEEQKSADVIPETQENEICDDHNKKKMESKKNIENTKEVKASSKSKRNRDVIAPRKQQSRKTKTTAASPFSFNESGTTSYDDDVVGKRSKRQATSKKSSLKQEKDLTKRSIVETDKIVKKSKKESNAKRMEKEHIPMSRNKEEARIHGHQETNKLITARKAKLESKDRMEEDEGDLSVTFCDVAQNTIDICSGDSQPRNIDKRLSFTDPRKVKKRPLKKTFGKAKTSKVRKELVEKDAGKKRALPKRSSETKRSFNRKTGKIQVGNFDSESDSSTDAIQVSNAPKNKIKTELKKTRRSSKKQIPGNKKNNISIADLVSIYEHRDMPEIAKQTDYAKISKKKTEKILYSFTESAGVEEIESKEIECRGKKNLEIKNDGYSDDDIEVDESYNSVDQPDRKESKENNKDSTANRVQVYELPQIQAQNVTDSEHEPVANTSKTRANKKTTRKQDIPQNRQIVTDKVVKRAMKQTGNKIAKPDVCPSNEDRDRQADINSCVLSSDEDLHVVDPVESFARICQSILDVSSKNLAMHLSSANQNNERGSLMVVKENRRSVDSGMVSDVSIASTLLLNSPTPNIGNQEEYIERKTEDKKNIGLSREDDSESNSQEEIRNLHEAAEEEAMLPRLKTPEVVKKFRLQCDANNTPSKESKRRKRDAVGQLKRQNEIVPDEDVDERDADMSTPIPVKRKKIKPSSDGNENQMLDCFRDEQTPSDRIINQPQSSSYGVNSLLETLREKVGGTLKKRECELSKFTAAAADLVKRNVASVWRRQRDEREKLIKDIDLKIKNEIESLKSDLQNQQEKQEKILELLLEHQEENIKSTKLHNQRLDKLGKLSSIFSTGLVSLADEHYEAQVKVEEQLGKEISKMHSKLVQESKKQELSNVRRQLNKVLTYM